MKRFIKTQALAASALALSAFTLTACNNDIEHFIPSVDAPSFVSVSPESNLKSGLDSIIVSYDKNIFFASSDYEKITLNGEPVVSAHVMGSSSQLLIMARIERDKTYELVIPDGIITGPNGTEAAGIKHTLKGQSQNISASLVNPNATAATKALYQKLLDNYGKKIFSGIMADVAWNTTEAEKVYKWTGKYPAINGYDYIHLHSSAPSGWIDYSNITPVSSWHNAGGIVTIGWHWNVPTSNPYASTVPVSLFSGSKEMPSDWSGNLQLTDQATKDILAKASVGSTLTVKITNVGSTAQGSIKNSNWAGFVDESGKSWEYFDISGNHYSMVLDQTTLREMQANGLIITGHSYTITDVTIEAAGKIEYSFRTEKNGFMIDEAVTKGTWAYQFIQSDLEKISAHLLQLQNAGIPVLWRPLHEAAGRWFWWGNGSAESYKKLWIMMFDYFKAKGINNLIWIWTSEGSDAAWYPGDAYVDIIGTDMYGQNGEAVSARDAAKRFDELAYRYPTKMITLSECGTVSEIPAQWSANANWSWFMPWYGSGSVVHASESWWKAAMASDKVITR